ncbi:MULTISPECIES: bifunctional 4-hydroxy-2-oxoglutarate aldolase/2-dehydro-3-deoxy-phosphogluconate aldolase [unclassified Lacticaseibacillus]|uniref:bifunctional 4-hydroxy-2-oxoglutarate aldolase/2-dehydro-3-deoxy-phosphogluconate aldolase n=1 Tax=unclassified Lacticaseibacillus TaxID=2759744 RepID=UPI00194569C4|nr:MULTISPECIES: bifunctional 4-hydroxy-2-oxoglutarate aldolase/2-dehydro-3-deoxy-phosphogluconate aldolase [unclassified Lacticaseibacillus]
MKVEEYPKFTVIMRGYTSQQADAILQALAGYESHFAIEMTTNTEHAVELVKQLNQKYGDKINIGAGTVLNISQAEQMINAGAKFMLGPVNFTQDMFALAKANNVVTVPAAFSPSEVYRLFQQGADIVKVFPADTLGSRYFHEIQAPLGKLPLMAVGGINAGNAQEYLDNGASYLGIGSGMFSKSSLASADVESLRSDIQKFLSAVGIND